MEDGCTELGSPVVVDGVGFDVGGGHMGVMTWKYSLLVLVL